MSNKTLHFTSGEDAYAACQCGEADVGDVLIIVEDGKLTVGVADTWPIAVTPDRAGLHSLIPGFDPADWAAETRNPVAALAGYHMAIAEAASRK